MEQVEGGDLIVNKGGETKPKEDGRRDMQAVEGLEAALKLAQVQSSMYQLFATMLTKDRPTSRNA